MEIQKHIDLKVDNGNFVIDKAGFSEPISDRESIGQDIKHRIIEGGLLFDLIAERSPIRRQQIINKVIDDIERDERLKPGTVEFLEVQNSVGTYYVTAKTFEYSDLVVYL